MHAFDWSGQVQHIHTAETQIPINFQQLQPDCTKTKVCIRASNQELCVKMYVFCFEMDKHSKPMELIKYDKPARQKHRLFIWFGNLSSTLK